MPGPFKFLKPSPALAIPAIQASRAPIHDHQRLGAALVAHGGAGREAGAVAGHGDVLGAGARGNRRRAHVTVFF